MGTTKIEWTRGEGSSLGSTWNPVTGCNPVSAGCINCYAYRMARRLRGRFGYPQGNPFEVIEHKDRWIQPLSWKKPRTIFVCSMGDLFHEKISDETRDFLFAVMALCPQHTFLILTKRVSRMKAYFDLKTDNREKAIGAIARTIRSGRYGDLVELPLSNVWIGVTAENQRTADERIPILLETPAAFHFVSCEPLLEPIELQLSWIRSDRETWIKGHPDSPSSEKPGGFIRATGACIDWVIIGGETGASSSPCDPSWIAAIAQQCRTTNVPVFVKQLGCNVVGLDLIDRRGADPREWPEELQIRELPKKGVKVIGSKGDKD